MIRYLQELQDISPLGYSVGIHIRFASPMFRRSSFPQVWQDAYTAGNFALRDPLVFWGISNTGTLRWSELALPDPFGILRQAAAHGLTYGGTASCGKITSRTIVGVARDDREFTDEELHRIAAIGDALHEVTGPPADLTPSMIGALRLIDRGVPQFEAAATLGITETEFEARLSSARNCLGAKTTAEAVRVAGDFELI